ncbi:MAG TPA: AAA family ATPase [Methylomirabilota bacterium]
MPSPSLRAVLVDSDASSRAAIRRLLTDIPTVTVAGEWHTVADALVGAPATRPDLLIVEVPAEADGGALGVTGIEQLVRKLPDTAILATGGRLSGDLVIRVLRAGALEYLARPVQRPDLVAALEKLARFRGTTTPRPAGRITSIYSPKGGLGATTLAANLSVLIAERNGGKTLLIELDTRQSDVVTFLDLTPRYSILDVLESCHRMDESLLRGLLTRHASGLSIAPGPTRHERAHLAAEEVTAALQTLSSHFDEVFIDLKHDLAPETVAALEVSDVILFVTGLDVASLRAGAAALTSFRHLGLDSRKVRIVVTRDRSGDDVTVKHARETLGLPVYWRTPSDYRTVVAAINAGRPVVSLSPRTKVSKSIRELAAKLCGDSAKGSGPKRRAASLLSMAWPIKRLSGA